MSKITRRNVLTGIAGFSLAAALGCKKKTSQSIKNAKLTDRASLTKLNVLVHGLSIIVINQGPAEKGINIFMPPFVDQANSAMSHIYLFGNLVYTVGHELDQMKPLNLDNICTLSGFTPGSRPSQRSFNPAINLVFPDASVNCNGCRQFNLPWTDQIQTVALIHREDNMKLMTDTNCGTTYGNTFSLSSICVFSYDLQDTDQPQITYDANGSTTGWQPQPQTGDSNPNYSTYANLHIFAEPKQADSDHAVQGFKLLMGDIGKTCLAFDPFPGVKMIQADDTPPPKGTSQHFDLKHLDSYRGGELANCVSAIIIQ